jgi:hypothetical protein
MQMMLSKNASRLSALLAVYSAACSSSDPIYGYSNNAAAGGGSWSMSESVLGVAPVPGLDISGVLYRYTAVKERPDDFTVSVQNQNAIDGGYIFRSTDDWSGKSGQTIVKSVPLGYVPIKYWGDGEIVTTGQGSVVDPQVVYTYRFIEPEPELPNLPTYTYNALEDPAVIAATEATERPETDEDEAKKDDEDEEKKDMEKALAALQSGLEMAKGQDGLLAAMNPVTMAQYYAATIPGGAYKETVILQGGEIKDNKRAFRSMANDRLHNQMVEEQYR